MPTQFYLFLAILQSVIFLLHWFVYKTLVFFFYFGTTPAPAVLTGLQVAFFILSISFLSASILAFKYKSYAVTLIYRVAATWLGSLYFTVAASCLIWVVYGLTPVSALDGPVWAAALFGYAVVLSIEGLVHSSTVHIVRTQVQLKNLPENWRGKKILFISDTHLGHFRGIAFAKRISRLAAKLNPDILLIGGDYYDGVTCDFDQLAAPLNDLKIRHGIYFATGNHEEFHLTEQFLQGLRNSGVRVLDNEMLNVEGLQLIGVDYADTAHRGDYEMVLDSFHIDRNLPSILIKHVPVDLDLAEKAGVSLQISGHTHRAQVWPLSYIGRAIFKGYDYGLKKFRSMSVLVSSGAGTWGPPMRVGTNSEVVLITLD